MKKLEDRIKKLEDEIERLKNPTYPVLPNLSGSQFMFDQNCLHNGCNHERNPVCHLYCPHCSPMC